MRIWYEEPASVYMEALPVGNGRQGAMIYGRTEDEILSLNEDSIWYGGDFYRDNLLAKENINKIRENLINGNVHEAEELAILTMTSTPQYMGPYLPVGDLKLHFYNHNSNVFNYKRELFLDKGLLKISYLLNGTYYEREIIASYVDNVILMRITADKPGQIGLRANLFRRPYDGGTKAVDNKTIAMYGECGKNGVEFQTVVRVIADGGSVDTQGNYLTVKNADSICMAICTCSTYRFENPLDEALKVLDSIQYDRAFEKHIMEHSEKMNRVSLELGSKKDEIPTNKRVESFKNGKEDNDLYSLYFQYGRYLLLASSRPGSLPANLQGIWNNNYTPPWESKYTANINLQMNYWPAEICNLSECHEPLLDFLKILENKGKKVAENMYGAEGFVVHHNTYMWGNCSVDTAITSCAIWPMAGGWLSLHLWEHYLFTLDEQYLKNYAYEIMKQSCKFFLSYMVEVDGQLLTGPSVSPENTYILKDGTKGSLCMSPSMDNQIIKELFAACILAGKIVGDLEFVDILGKNICKVPDIRIGSDGRILEWQEEYDEFEKGHRHISHLFGLYPGNTINTAEFKAAAEKTIKYRISNDGGGTGWSRAWLVNMYARLKNANKALENLEMLLKEHMETNLFDTCPSNDVTPVFQIDGNLGGCAGIAEMLVQSHDGYIELLPALPDAWKNGNIKGIRVRGGYTFDVYWECGKLKKAIIHSDNKGKCSIAYKLQLKCKDSDIENCMKQGDVYITDVTVDNGTYIIEIN